MRRSKEGRRKRRKKKRKKWEKGENGPLFYMTVFHGSQHLGIMFMPGLLVEEVVL